MHDGQVMMGQLLDLTVRLVEGRAERAASSVGGAQACAQDAVSPTRLDKATTTQGRPSMATKKTNYYSQLAALSSNLSQHVDVPDMLAGIPKCPPSGRLPTTHSVVN